MTPPKPKKTAIIGYGYVGKALGEMFPDALFFDPVNPASSRKQDINRQCDFAIIAVPTPMLPDGSCDTSIVESSVAWLRTPHILIKSTVPPGTIAKLSRKYRKKLVFSPEYTGESKYWSPYNWKIVEEPFLILGGPRTETGFMLNLFKKKMGPVKRYFQTDSTTAEMVKYMENAFYATKVTFCNEFFEIARVFGVDYNELRELFIADPRLSPMHTLVFEDKRGFDGKCFPKDLNAIVQAAAKKKYDAKLLREVLTSNVKFRGERLIR